MPVHMRLIGLLIIACFPSSLQGQNLIPNPGFDDLTACPDQPSQIGRASPWTSATLEGTPDLYNTCSTDNKLMVPYAGPLSGNYQQQRSGTGYAGIGLYFDNAAYKEYLQVPLLSTLIEGKQYYIEFYVSLFSRPIDNWVYTDDLGLAFAASNDIRQTDLGEALPMSMAIKNQNGLINDTMAWMRISGCYTANGNESYAIIGNFKSDDATHIVAEDTSIWPLRVYIFIEDVLVQDFDPLPDTLTLCDDIPLFLNAAFLDAAYSWNTGASTAAISTSKPGTYQVDVIMDQCILHDSVSILQGDLTESHFKDTTLCQGDVLTLESPGPGILRWSTGHTGHSIEIQSAGQYQLTVTNDCGDYTLSAEIDVHECACQFYIPNILSLNGDGINDNFNIQPDCDFPYRILRFTLYDRWGNALYESDGQETIDLVDASNTKGLPTGVYAWALHYVVMQDALFEEQWAHGDITILR